MASAPSRIPAIPPAIHWAEISGKEYDVRVMRPKHTSAMNAELVINNYENDKSINDSLVVIETFLSGYSSQKETTDKLMEHCITIKDVLPAWGSFNKKDSEQLHKVVGYLVSRKKEQICTDQQKFKIYETIVLNFTDKDFLLDVIANVSMFVTPARRLQQVGPKKNALALIKIAAHFFSKIDTECKEQFGILKNEVATCRQRYNQEEQVEYASLRELFHLPPVPVEKTPPLAVDPTPGFPNDDDFVIFSSEGIKKREEIKKKQHAKMREVFHKLMLKFGPKIAPRMWKKDSRQLELLEKRFESFSAVKCFRSPQEVQNFELIAVREILKSLTQFLDHIMLHPNLYNPDVKEDYEEQIKAFSATYAKINPIDDVRSILISEVESFITLISESSGAEIEFASLFGAQAVAEFIEEQATIDNLGYLFLRFWEEKPEKDKPRFETFDEPRSDKVNEDQRYSKYISDVLFEFIKKGFSMAGESKGFIVGLVSKSEFIIKKVMEHLRDKYQNDLQKALEKIKGSEAMMMPFLIVEHLFLKEKGNIMPFESFLKMDPLTSVNTTKKMKTFVTEEIVKLIDQSVAETLLKTVFHRVWQILQCEEVRLNAIIFLLRGVKNAIISKRNGNIVIY